MLAKLHSHIGKYQVARTALQPVGEILELMEGTLAPVACLADKDYDCPRAGICLTLPMWKEFSAEIKKFFQRYTIADLANKEVKQDESWESSVL